MRCTISMLVSEVDVYHWVCSTSHTNRSVPNNMVKWYADTVAKNKLGVYVVPQMIFTLAQVAQAFSHFSYLHSDHKRLVCDLQGVYDEKKNILPFSDPVIHYYNPLRTDRRGVHGRTDRGRDGIKDFFATHSCKEQGHLCQLVTCGFRSTRPNHRRPSIVLDTNIWHWVPKCDVDVHTSQCRTMETNNGQDSLVWRYR